MVCVWVKLQQQQVASCKCRMLNLTSAFFPLARSHVFAFSRYKWFFFVCLSTLNHVSFSLDLTGHVVWWKISLFLPFFFLFFSLSLLLTGSTYHLETHLLFSPVLRVIFLTNQRNHLPHFLFTHIAFRVCLDEKAEERFVIQVTFSSFSRERIRFSLLLLMNGKKLPQIASNVFFDGHLPPTRWTGWGRRWEWHLQWWVWSMWLHCVSMCHFFFFLLFHLSKVKCSLPGVHVCVLSELNELRWALEEKWFKYLYVSFDSMAGQAMGERIECEWDMNQSPGFQFLESCWVDFCSSC